MFMAIAVEPSKDLTKKTDYKVWYLEFNQFNEVICIGSLTREKLVQNIFSNFRKKGKTNWRAFLKEKEKSVEIEIFDFIAMELSKNTHFGELPTLSEFQETINYLQMNFEIQSIAC